MKLVFVLFALLSIYQTAFTGDVTSFCNGLVGNCTGANKVYDTAADCIAVMNTLVTADGTDGETSGNTKACRIYHGGAPATSDPATHCPHASNTGGTVCGSLKQVYCEQLAAACPTQYAAVNCTLVVETFPTGAMNDTGANSLYCRLYHMKAGAAGAALATHCPHAGYTGGDGVCGSLCESYCSLIKGACSGANVQYASDADCMKACGAFPKGASGDTATNSLYCRLYHAGVALGAAATHCPHAGPTGGDACGTRCEAFCQETMAACTGANAAYADLAACTTACAKFPVGTAGATSGDSLACREYHLGVALSAPATHCAHITASNTVCGAPKPSSSSSSSTGNAMTLIFSVVAIVIAMLI